MARYHHLPTKGESKQEKNLRNRSPSPEDIFAQKYVSMETKGPFKG